MRLAGAMNNNKLMIAAAGSGKTRFLVKAACKQSSETVLITTYTEANEAEIVSKIVRRKGYIPSNVTVQTWFSFLLQHGVRPYQSALDDSIHEEDIGFYLTSEKSGRKTDSDGNPLTTQQGYPIYWGEQHFKRHYFTSKFKIYSDKLSKFIIKCDKAADHEVVRRISRIFDHIYVDEVQDLAGYDLDMIKALFASRSSVLLVGDPRQVTYLTHHATRYAKYADGKIQAFVENELGRRIACDVDDKTLNVSHRNNQAICDYSCRLYPDFEKTKACQCAKCRATTTDHEGVFLVRPSDVDEYLDRFKPMQLRWSVATRVRDQYAATNFGESKGATFERVLIYPTDDMSKWIKNNQSAMKNKTRAKLYVAITRARRSAAIVLDYRDDEIIDGVEKYSAL